jgi:hypothetical protein
MQNAPVQGRFLLGNPIPSLQATGSRERARNDAESWIASSLRSSQ